MKKLEDSVAVVTGAGSGIGRATSEHLARAGCHVAVVDVNAASAEETAARVRALGRRASVHVADVASRARMEALPAEVVAALGPPQVVVNNAGVTVARSFEGHSLEDLEWIVGINFWGVVYGCKVFLPHLRIAPEAHIVNVASLAAFVGLPLQSSYCATKFAVRGFTESLAAELASTRIGVTAVFPGPIRTQVLRSSRHDGGGSVDRLADLLERHARPPSTVATRIVHAILNDKSRVVVGAEARLTWWVSRLSPGLLVKLLGWSFGKARAHLVEARGTKRRS
jgi:NAD(P)-dependent dehydrogenase (short-subunit alcohol dehydrogenase family)